MSTAAIFVVACLIACPAAMGLMMLAMRRGHRSDSGEARSAESGDGDTE